MAETTNFYNIPPTVDTCWPWQGIRSGAGGIVNALFQVPDQMVFGIAGTTFEANTLINNTTPTVIALSGLYTPVDGNDNFVAGNYLNPPNAFANNISANLIANTDGTITNTSGGDLNLVVTYSATLVSTSNVTGDLFNIGLSINGVAPEDPTKFGITNLPAAGSLPVSITKTFVLPDPLTDNNFVGLQVTNLSGIRNILVNNAQILVQRQIG